ncbi:MAG: hypothetical protein KDC54_19265, partial [Lewinella sp.]|nr:hypothetical protein [Lewinella sp.]
MRIGLLIASLLMVLTGQLHAQSCGRSDTLLIPTNTANLTFTIPIADYVNDDLSAPDQGLCGIELSFVHQFVENLELSLTSPGGQTVQLIGPNSDDQFDFTFFTQWQISFVPGGSMPFPDPGFAPQWDNEQPNSFFSGALY